MSLSFCSIFYTLLCSLIFVHSTKHLERFSHPDIEHYGQLHFDPQNYKLFVGARDYILTLGLENFDSITKQLYNFPADEKSIKLCIIKGTPKHLCHNFINAILPIPDKKNDLSTDQILICGTNAFSPMCETRSISILDSPGNGFTKINSFSPLWNTTSLIASNGQFFYAGPLDFLGIDRSISRQNISPTNSDPSKRTIVRSVQQDFKWLNNDANFVGSFEHDHHVYFLFRETAIEFMNSGKRIVSRLGRVCKDDIGLRKSTSTWTWTSFLKSRLLCSIDGETPFYFDEIESIHWIDNKLYAIFNTPSNSIHGSAICSFDTNSIESSFNGPFQIQRSTDKIWEPVMDKHDVFQCRVNHSSSSTDFEVDYGKGHQMNSLYQLMNQPVYASKSNPLVISKQDHFKFIAVDLVRTQYHETVEVIFVVTTDAKLLKYVRWPTLSEPCIVDEIQLTESNNDQILTMKLLKDTQSLYFGTQKEIIRIQLHQCSQHKTRDRCLTSGDPYCGWNESKMKCTKAPGDNHRDSTWYQLKEPVCTNQRWSRWSECSMLGDISGEKQHCLCRKRPCINSEHCLDGFEMQVTNCTQHGSWSEWSAWSSCSPACGRGIQQRTRSCTNPIPRNGGRGCEGKDREIRECSDLPYCKWNDWSSWSNCTCGGNEVRQRFRHCVDFAGNSVDKSFCFGQDSETAFCDCRSQHSQWTEWFISEVNGGEAIEQRVELNSETDMSSAKREKRVTPLPYSDICDGFVYPIKHRSFVIKECKSFDVENSRVWSEWSPWTNCVNGTQHRARACLLPNKNCYGNFEEARFCNVFHRELGNEIFYSAGIISHGWSSISVFFLILFIIILTSFLTGILVIYLTRKRLRQKSQDNMSGSEEKLGNFGLIRPYPNSEPNTYEEPEKYRILPQIHHSHSATQNHYLQNHHHHHHQASHHTSQMNMSTLTRHSSTLKKQTSFKAKLDDCNYN